MLDPLDLDDPRMLDLLDRINRDIRAANLEAFHAMRPSEVSILMDNRTLDDLVVFADRNKTTRDRVGFGWSGGPTLFGLTVYPVELWGAEYKIILEPELPNVIKIELGGGA